MDPEQSDPASRDVMYEDEVEESASPPEDYSPKERHEASPSPPQDDQSADCDEASASASPQTKETLKEASTPSSKHDLIIDCAEAPASTPQNGVSKDRDQAPSSSPGSGSSPEVDGAPETCRFPAPAEEMSLRIAEHRTNGHLPQANLDALETTPEIVSILNMLNSERNRTTDEDGYDSTVDAPRNDSVTTNTMTCLQNIENNGVYPTDTSEDDSHHFLPIPIPSHPTSPTTVHHESVLKKRIIYSKLAPGAEYDTRSYTPTFIHDCLMLPGTLATVTGKRFPTEILNRMTPALLPGFHGHVHTQTQQPCILQSHDPQDFVQGMLIFGQARAARDRIHAHYRDTCRRVKVQVEVEFLAPNPSENAWVLFRKRIWAHAWLWANVGSGDVEFRGVRERWTLEEYLAGKLGGERRMMLGEEGWIGEDFEDGKEVVGGERRDEGAVGGGCEGVMVHSEQPNSSAWVAQDPWQPQPEEAGEPGPDKKDDLAQAAVRRDVDWVW
ncbi:uncharacterized protein LTR77_007365 [Saxophila tyrrhenica]|uniref:Uncharacterized protein n=1 Tax=Saxophila tyrrhenica TaxID=1690608 RepID=A0AAV9P4I7_9PEZI|nr:hypothetical protein LTR77_007365 [Saxophila tyrrhenica]